MPQIEMDAPVDFYRVPFITGRTGQRIATSSVSSRNNIIVLSAMMDELRPKRTLEIGLALGASALALAGKHRDAGVAPAEQHIAIDPFQESVWDDCGVLAIQAAGLSGYCSVMRDSSSLALPRLLDAGQEFGLLYIDGSHLFEDVIVDLFYCARLVSRGGVVLFDDASDQHVAKVIRFARRNMQHAFREMDLEKYRCMTTRVERLKYRAACALGRQQLVCFERIGDPVRAWNSSLVPF